MQKIINTPQVTLCLDMGWDEESSSHVTICSNVYVIMENSKVITKPEHPELLKKYPSVCDSEIGIVDKTGPFI